MQESGEKLTIAEFAARAGCSTQRIYQLLQNSLQPFAIVENGRKYVHSDGLQIVLDARKKQGFAKGTETLANSFETLASPEKVADLTAELAAVRDQIDQMREDLTDAQQRAAVAAAERDAERKRADTAEQQLKDAQDKHEQKESELTARLDSVMEKLHEAETAAAAARAGLDAEQKRTEDLKQQLAAKDAQISEALQRLAAEQALHAGTISQQKQIETAAEIPADDQPGDDQSDGSSKPGFFARLFRRKKQ